MDGRPLLLRYRHKVEHIDKTPTTKPKRIRRQGFLRFQQRTPYPSAPNPSTSNERMLSRMARSKCCFQDRTPTKGQTIGCDNVSCRAVPQRSTCQRCPVVVDPLVPTIRVTISTATDKDISAGFRLVQGLARLAGSLLHDPVRLEKSRKFSL